MHRHKYLKPDFIFFEKGAIDLICKGAAFMGVGIGLNVVLKVIGRKLTTMRVIYTILVYSYYIIE